MILLKIMSLVLTIVLLFGSSEASTPPPVSSPVLIESKSAILGEPETESIIYEHNADERIAPASLTKILTLYLVFEALEKGSITLEDEVFISKRAWKTGGSQMFIEVGNKVPLEELIKGIAVASGNDACVALAEHISGTVESFVVLMNQKAQELGLKNSYFTNPHGLDDPEQYSTARDMLKLATSYIKRFPQALQYHSMKEYTFNNIVQYNRNRLLLRDPSIDGLKTGFVAAGGYHLIATAKRDEMRLIAVVMGASKPSVREKDALQLLSYGFRNYTVLHPVKQSESLGHIKVWKGVKDQIPAYPLESKTLFLPREEVGKIKKEIEMANELVAPVRAGEIVGQVKIYKGNELIDSIPIISGDTVEKATLPKRLWHFIVRLFKGSEPPQLPSLYSTAKFVGITILALILALLVLRIVRRRRKKKAVVRRFPRR